MKIINTHINLNILYLYNKLEHMVIQIPTTENISIPLTSNISVLPIFFLIVIRLKNRCDKLYII